MSLDQLYQEAVDHPEMYPELVKPVDARKENRFRRLVIGQDEMLQFYRRLIEHDSHADAPSFFVTFAGMPALPADAWVDSVHYDSFRRAFSILLSSAEFEPVPFGEEIPCLPVGDRKAVKTPAASCERMIVDGSECPTLPERIEKLSPQPGDILAVYYPEGMGFESAQNVAACLEELATDSLRIVMMPTDMKLSLLPGTAAGIPVSLPPVVKTWEGQDAADAPSAQDPPKIERVECWGAGRGAGGASDRDAVYIGNGQYGVGDVGQELPPGSVAKAEFALNLPPRDEKLLAIMERHRPGKSEARRDIPTYRDAATGNMLHSAIVEPPAKSEARLALEYDLRQRLKPLEGSDLDRAISRESDEVLTVALNSADGFPERVLLGKPGRVFIG